MITLEQAKELKHGTTIYHETIKNADGTAARARVFGKVKTWKRSPNRVQVPMKHGLRDHFYLTERNMGEFTLVEPERVKVKR